MVNIKSWLAENIRSFRGFQQTCRENKAPLLPVLLGFYWRKRKGVNILASPEARISGLCNISTPNGTLNLILNRGPIDGLEPTVINVEGQLRLLGHFTMGRGCRVDIGPEAIMEVGARSFFNPRTQVVIKHGLRIGQDCAISWECQFLDEDFHQISYAGQRPSHHPEIIIGDRVWIGSRVSIYKGAVIPNGCVVASNSVVKSVFTEENALLAGSPARVVRHNVHW